MDMGMMLQLLIPGVQHAEETDLGAEMSGIASLRQILVTNKRRISSNGTSC
jgi:hypothetical protein